MRTMRARLLPNISAAQFRKLLAITALTTLAACLFGATHDQLTYSISPEYYHKLKFAQFPYTELGLAHRLRVALIGAIAAGGPGLLCGWLVARRIVDRRCTTIFNARFGYALLALTSCTSVFALLGWGYGICTGPANLDEWTWTLQLHAIDDRLAFIRVAYIHTASYVGAVVGLVVALLIARPRTQARD